MYCVPAVRNASGVCCIQLTPHCFLWFQALLCLAALVGGNRLQQDQLASLTVRSRASGEAQPLLQAALQAAVEGSSAAEQTAADRLLEAYCTANPAGQAAVVSSLHSAGPPTPGSWGGYLLLCLGRQGSLGELAASARAAVALSHLVAGNPGAQPQLLAVGVQLTAAAGSPLGGSAKLMVLCTSHLAALVTQHGRQPASMAAAADLLRLLLLWLHACPPAVTAFLRAVAQSQPFLVDSVRGSNACYASASSTHPVTRGMLALLLGLCASYAEEGAGTPTQQQLLGAIGQQVGLEQYLSVLDALLQHPAVAASAGASSSGSSSVFAEGPLPSPAFAAFLRALAMEVRQRVTGGPSPPLPPPAAPAAAPPAAAPAAAAAVPKLQHPPVFQPPAQPPAFFHPPPPPPLPPAATAALLPNGVAPWSRPSSQATSPRPVQQQHLQQQYSFASHSSAPSPQPASPHWPPQPASVPMFPSASVAAAVLGSPRSTPPLGSPRAVSGTATPRRQQAHALVDTLQR